MAKALDRLERALEGLMRDSITRRMGGRLHPVEIAKRLAQEMEANQTITARRILAPNLYTVCLNPSDLEPLAPIRETLQRELAAYLSEAMAERQLSPVAYPRVEMVADESIPRRQMRVQAQMIEPEAEAPLAPEGHTARLDLPPAGKGIPGGGWVLMPGPTGQELRCPVDRFPFSLGRALDNDLILEDRGVSRHHAQIRQIHGRPYLLDLGSTNGTLLNGSRVTERLLRDGDIISLGQARLVFRWERE